MRLEVPKPVFLTILRYDKRVLEKIPSVGERHDFKKILKFYSL